jgi:uroporphyrinogen decarboxylase
VDNPWILVTTTASPGKNSMNARRLVQKTLTFDSPERIPRHKGILPWAEENFPDFVRRLHDIFPDDIVSAPAVYTRPLKTRGERYKKGTYTDEWGCFFTNPLDGVIGIVQTPLVSGWRDLEKFEPPDATLSLDREAINAFCRETDRFVLMGSFVRPFERLQFVRTMENALIDLVEKPPELYVLLDKIHQHYLKEVKAWAETDVDAISVMDDWGTQKGLIASPDVFRQIFLPMYEDYAEIARHHGKYLFMHSDGYIMDIIPDLIEAGVDALNAQIFCMGIEELGERYRGKLTFWGEIDRQTLLPHGSIEDIRQAVYAIWHHLYQEGGVIGQCEFGLEANPENVFAVYETWDTLSRKGRGE